MRKSIMLGLAAATCAPCLAVDPLWVVDTLTSCSYGGSAVADVDGDGEVEILFGTYYNDERVVGLHHDGAPFLSLQSGASGPVDNSVTLADLDLDGRPEILWGNSESAVFHVGRWTGSAYEDIWTEPISATLDAPEAVGDVNGDGVLDIVLASCGNGGLRAFEGMTGELLWTAEISGCYQSAPLLFDQDGDGLLDVLVSTWFDSEVLAFSGLDGTVNWQATIGDWTYHAGSFGDLNGDGVPDVALGDYSATLWALDGSDGSELWSKTLAGETYIFGPTAMGDLDGDGNLEVVVTGYRLAVYDHEGNVVTGMSTVLPGFCARGPVLTDLDDDDLPDILVATDGTAVTVYSGLDASSVLYSHAFAEDADHDHQPVVADLDGDGVNDVFTVYGRGYYDTMEQNWGKAAALPLGGSGPGWPTFSHDHHHSGNYHYPPGELVNTLVFTDGFESGDTSAW